jgi:hypothetical protein
MITKLDVPRVIKEGILANNEDLQLTLERRSGRKAPN